MNSQGQEGRHPTGAGGCEACTAARQQACPSSGREACTAARGSSMVRAAAPGAALALGRVDILTQPVKTLQARSGRAQGPQGGRGPHTAGPTPGRG